MQAAAKMARQRADLHMDLDAFKDMTSKSPNVISGRMFLDELSTRADVAWQAYVSNLKQLFPFY
jgi:hypothetical protein